MCWKYVDGVCCLIRVSMVRIILVDLSYTATLTEICYLENPCRNTQGNGVINIEVKLQVMTKYMKLESINSDY